MWPVLMIMWQGDLSKYVSSIWHHNMTRKARRAGVGTLQRQLTTRCTMTPVATSRRQKMKPITDFPDNDCDPTRTAAAHYKEVALLGIRAELIFNGGCVELHAADQDSQEVIHRSGTENST